MFYVKRVFVHTIWPQAKLLLRMLAYMSESIKDAFMVDELRARIAQMLGYFLDHLVGKKSKGLKVCICTVSRTSPPHVFSCYVIVVWITSSSSVFLRALTDSINTPGPFFFNLFLYFFTNSPTILSPEITSNSLLRFGSISSFPSACFHVRACDRFGDSSGPLVYIYFYRLSFLLFR